ncbi:MAG: lipopolysaccharide biosynthesis protein [bacterium]
MGRKLSLRRIYKWIKEESFKKLIKNTVTLLIGDTGASIINMISIMLILKIIGAEGYGIMVLIQTYALTIDKLLNFQSWQAFIKYGAMALEEKDHNGFKKLIKQGTILDISTAILGTLVAILIVGIVGSYFNWNNSMILYSKLYSVVILFHFSGVPIGILRIYNKFKYFSIQKLAVSLVKLVGIIFAYFFKLDFYAILLINLITDIIGHILLIVIAYTVLHKNGISKWWNQRVKIKNNFFYFALWTNLSSTLTIPSKQLDVFIVSSVLSVEMVGIYKGFKQIASMVGRLVNPIYQSIYPELAAIIAKNDSRSAIKIAIKTSIIISIVIIPLIAISGLSSPLWLEILFGEAFAQNWFYFFVFLVYVGLDTLTAPIHPLFNALGYVKQKFFIMGLGNIVYLFLAWVLGTKFGLIGIINAWGGQFLIITFMKIIYIKESHFIKVGNTNV